MGTPCFQKLPQQAWRLFFVSQIYGRKWTPAYLSDPICAQVGDHNLMIMWYKWKDEVFIWRVNILSPMLSISVAKSVNIFHETYWSYW